MHDAFSTALIAAFTEAFAFIGAAVRVDDYLAKRFLTLRRGVNARVALERHVDYPALPA
jgi:hypothetical protein